MNRNLRVTIGVLATSAALLGASVPAGAAGFKIDAIMKNDLNLKAAPSPQLVMGGSSFDANLALAAQTQWNSDNHKTAFATYNTTKSGTGRANAITGAYNVGFSDFPLNQVPGSPDVGPGSSHTGLSTANFAQVPVALGGVAIIYHFGTGISGTTAACLRKHPLTLTGSLLGKVFAGKITNWDNAAIGKANAACEIKGKTPFPNLAINVLSRTSGSGTTFIFKGYLNQVDRADYPTVDANAFTAATATFANSGLLASAVSNTNGAIGYVEFGYAVANNTPTISLVNKSGKIVPISVGGIVQAATVGLKAINSSSCKGFNTSSLRCYEINNEAGATVYPIAGFSYAIVYKAQLGTAKADGQPASSRTAAIAEVKFLDYLSHQGGGKSRATTFGQDFADANGYAPMPTLVQNVARKVLLGVTFAGHAVLNASD